MASIPQASLSKYESLLSEWTTITRTHDASILAAAKSRTAFIIADRNEIRALKRTLTSNTNLITRSNVYRKHLKFCTALSRRLLTCNSDLRDAWNRQDVDELDLLTYGADFYRFWSAASRLAVMNQRGMQAKVVCERRYDDVDRMRKRKEVAKEKGRKAYDKQAAETSKVCDFFTKVSKFLGGIAKQGAGRQGIIDVSAKLELWLDAIEERVSKEVARPEEERNWERVCKSDIVKEGVDARNAVEEEALYRGFDELLWNETKKSTWCPCCGTGNSQKGHRR